jgi:hypothetical protein
MNAMGEFTNYELRFTRRSPYLRSSRREEALIKTESLRTSGSLVQSETPHVVSYKDHERRSRGHETLTKNPVAPVQTGQNCSDNGLGFSGRNRFGLLRAGLGGIFSSRSILITLSRRSRFCRSISSMADEFSIDVESVRSSKARTSPTFCSSAANLSSNGEKKWRISSSCSRIESRLSFIQGFKSFVSPPPPFHGFSLVCGFSVIRSFSNVKH